MNQEQLVQIIGQQTCEILFLRSQIAGLNDNPLPAPPQPAPPVADQTAWPEEGTNS